MSIFSRLEPFKNALPIYGLIIFLALLLRVTGLDFESLWLDEGYQSLVGAYGHGPPDFLKQTNEPFLFRFEKPAPLNEVLSRFRTVDPLCPPLYACLLNGWMHLFGESDFTIRLLSVTASLLSITALFAFCLKLFGKEVAIAASLIQCISPFDVHYAQEARMYSLILLCSVLSTGALIYLIFRADKPLSRGLFVVIYAVSTWALINGHYTSLFLLAAQSGLSALYVISRKDWKLLGWLFLSWLGIACLWLPWSALFLSAASIRKESFYVARQASWSWPFFALFIRIPINWISFLCGQRVTAYAAPVYLSSAAMLLSAAQTYWSKQKSASLTPLHWSILLWALVPAFGLWLIDVMENHRVIEVARYTIFTAPAIYILAGFGILHLWTRFSWGKWLAFVHIAFALVNLVYSHSIHQKEPWKELARTVELECKENQPIIVSQFYDIALLDRYLRSPHKQIGMSPAMGQQEIENRLSGLDSFALVTAQDGESIKDMLPKQFELVKEINLSHGLHLRLYRSQE